MVIAATLPPVAIQMETTRLFKEIMQAWLGGKRRFLMEGGQSSSKTFTALQFLKVLAESSEQPLIISIVSESVPHLKKGVIRDFFRIIGELQDNNPRWNATDHIYSFPKTGSIIEFFSASDPEKARGPRRQVLFINEGNNVYWEAAQNLDSRTDMFTIVDWNPTSQFWAHEYWLNLPDTQYSHSTYLDALSVLPPGVVSTIESYKDKDPNWWNIYGLGLLGKIEGLVYPSFDQVDKLPAGPVTYGLDFGASDPTVLIKNVVLGGHLYSQEMFAEPMMDVSQIARAMEMAGVRGEPVYPDPDEPLIANELRTRYHYHIGETVKGKGSVEFGIKKVNQYYQHWTRDSVGAIKAQRNHRYLLRREPRTGHEYLSDETTHQWSHCLIAGTMIHSKRGQVPIELVTTDDYVLTRWGWQRVLASGMTSPLANVQTVLFSNGSKITGTPDHLLYTQKKGFVSLNTCRYGDIIKVCEDERQSNTMVKDTIGIPKLLTGRTECITADPVSVLTLKQSVISTAKCGLMFTERFQKMVKSITKMETRLIMCLVTLSVVLERGITLSIQHLFLSGNVNGCELTLGNISVSSTLGIAPPKDRLFIKNLASYRGKGENHTNKYATTVGENILLEKTQVQLDSAPITVNQVIVERRGKTILRRFVSGAGKLIEKVNMSEANVAAPVYVLSVSGLHKDKQPVYDLTIAGMPEFYANGILVHNSLDARRYAVASLVVVSGSESLAVSNVSRQPVAVSNTRRVRW